jgi:hypothetical protein
MQNDKTLTKVDIDWLEVQRRLIAERKLGGKKKAVIRMQYWRFRKKFLKTVEMLSAAANLLPEKQKKHIITSETVKPLIEALLTYESEEKSKFVANERAFKIVWMFMEESQNKGRNLISRPYADAFMNFRQEASPVLELMGSIRFLLRAKHMT